MCERVVLCACEDQKDTRLPEVGVKGARHDECWELKLCPLEEYQVLVLVEPSLTTGRQISSGLDHTDYKSSERISQKSQTVTHSRLFLANTDKTLGLIFSFKRKQIASQYLGCKSRQMDL